MALGRECNEAKKLGRSYDILDIGRRLPLELHSLQSSLYQGQQGDVSQSVRGNHETYF